ncbi:MAG: hypothetical protein ACI87W_003458 [Halieaceae bacterium]|jgi:hypothetical protein
MTDLNPLNAKTRVLAAGLMDQRLLRAVTRFVRATLISLLVAAAIVWGPSLLSDTVTLYRWDNVEYFAAVIDWAHRNLLSGELSRVNLAQQLGDPFAAHIQAGYFYPLYTLAVGLNILISGGYESLVSIIACLHFALGIAGYRAIAILHGIKSPLAWGLATAAIAGGYTMAYAGVWIVVLAVQAWMPWCLFGILRYARASRASPGSTSTDDVTGLAIFVLGSAMIGLLGHAQFWAYAQLFLSLAAFGCLIHDLRRLGRWVIAAGIAVLLAMPTLLPLLFIFPELERSNGIALNEFLAVSAQWHELAGLISPWTSSGSWGLPPSQISLFSFQGAHIAPLLLLAFWLLRNNSAQSKDLPRSSRSEGALWLGIWLLALVFALGENTPVYPLTYHIPLWSEFRWPSKFMLFAQSFLALYAIWGVSRLSQSAVNLRAWRAACVLSLAALLLMFIWHHVPDERSVSAASLALLVVSAMLLLLLCQRRIANVPRWLGALLVLSALCYAAMVHDQNLKPFQRDYKHTVHRFDGAYRVTPTTADTVNLTRRMSELDLGLTAMVQGYCSLSGYHTATTVLQRYSDTVTNFLFGTVARHWFAWASTNNILDFLAVRYGVAYLEEDFALLEQNGFRWIRTAGGAEVYENSNALPLIFLAQASYPDELDWTKPASTVRLPDSPRKSWAQGTVETIHYTTAGNIEAEGHVQGPALLVTSTLAYPGWSVSVNQQPQQRPLVVNDGFLGVELPAGPFSVRWRYTPPGLYYGIAAALVGLFSLLLIAAWYLPSLRAKPAGHDTTQQ